MFLGNEKSSCKGSDVKILDRQSFDYNSQEVQYVLEYSLDLEDLAKNPDMPKGLGKVTIYGGKLESSNQTRELRDVYRRDTDLHIEFPCGVLGTSEQNLRWN